MKKFIYFINIFVVLFLLSGCHKIGGKDIATTKTPKNNLLSIKGSWKVDSVEIVDENLNIASVDNDITDSEINISDSAIEIKDVKYDRPKYKLKVVDKNYMLSYEDGLKVSSFINNDDKIDVISIINKNNTLIGEFIIKEKDRGFLFYRGMILELSRISENVEDKDYPLENKNNYSDESAANDYNSEVGVMLGLKVPRKKNEDGGYTKEKYRTLWISFKDGELQPIMEKENIIFPRMTGIWALKSNTANYNGNEIEYFNVSPIDGKEVEVNSEIKDKNVYKNIKFVGNNYIAIEKYEGNDFQNKFPIYQVIPIDNINAENGIIIEEIYSKDASEKYKIAYENELSKLSAESKAKLNTNIDYSNFSIERKEGKWKLVGKISPVDLNSNGLDYAIGLNPNKKLLNYDALTVPWKVLKGELPLIRDAYIAPTERIAIIVFEDNIAVYEVENRRLKGSPLVNIKLNGEEEVIMAEWSSQGYVKSWSNVFSDGRNVMEEEE